MVYVILFNLYISICFLSRVLLVVTFINIIISIVIIVIITVCITLIQKYAN